MQYGVLEGDVLEVAATLDAGSFDAILCDPPYGLGFMGMGWDTFASEAGKRERGRDPTVTFDHVGGNHNPSDGADRARTHRRENERFQAWTTASFAALSSALKPGAHIMAFGGTRTFHRLAVALEDAGFEIRDTLAWLYGQGFPKSHNFGRELPGWNGYGTSLKPAFEPVILAMRPLAGTFAANALEHGVAGLNVDGARIDAEGDTFGGGARASSGFVDGYESGSGFVTSTKGRWPANVLLDEEAAAALDQATGNIKTNRIEKPSDCAEDGNWGTLQGRRGARGYSDEGGASRFFYTAKANRAERDAGLAGFERRPLNWSAGTLNPGSFQSEGTDKTARNNHPCVKPVELCRYLATLLLPPRRASPRRLLVPFCGSGSEMVGALLAGWDEVVGIELNPEYARIARARLDHWAPQQTGLFEEVA